MAEKTQTAFEKALTDAALSRYQTILEEDASPVQFSDAYKAFVARQTKRTSGKTWKYVNTAWKRILIAAILMFLLAATAVAAVPALREGLIRFFTHDDGIAYSFEFSQEDLDRAPKEIEIFYHLGYIPPGYKQVSENIADAYNSQAYMNESEELIFFQQIALWQYEEHAKDEKGIASVFGVDAENSTIERRVICGYEMVIVHLTNEDNSETIMLCWTDHSYFYALREPALSDIEIERIIDGIIPR